MALKHTPEGYHSVTPSLIVADAAAALDFYRRALGARELYRLTARDGAGRERIGHAEMQIGDSRVMLSDEWPNMDCLGPLARGGASTSLLVYVEDVDGTYQQALDAGASPTRPVENQFWGDRMGTLTDPFGHQWSLATHVEDVSESEMQTRMAAFSEQQKESEPA